MPFNFKTKHICELETFDQTYYPGELPCASPFAGFFSKLRWKLQYHATVSRKHPRTNLYFRSRFLITKEKSRHLKTPAYYFTIHPFCGLMQQFCAIRALVWCFTIFYEPYMSCFHYRELFMPYGDEDPDAWFLHLIFKIYNIFELFSLLVHFFTGYTIDETRTVVLDLKMIMKKYFFSYFMLDLIPVVSCWLFYIWQDVTIYKKNLIYQLRALRLFRTVTMMQYIDDFMLRYRVHYAVRYIFFLTYSPMMIIHIMTCFFASAPINEKFLEEKRNWESSWRKNVVLSENVPWEDLPKFYLYKHVFILINGFFFGAPYNFGGFAHTEKLILIMTMILGYGYFLVAIAYCLIFFGIVNVSESKYEQLQERINIFMESKIYPRELQVRIQQFYDFKYGRRFFQENKILLQLTEHLRNEVLLYSCKLLIEKVQMFKGLSRPAIGALLTILRHDTFLAGDVIVQADQVTDSVFLVLHGTCAIILPNGNELTHVEDGDEFGDTVKLKREDGLTLGLVAIEPTEMYYLTKSDLVFVGKLYAEITTRIESVLSAKRRLYEALLEDDESVQSLKGDEDIIIELRKDRILGKRRRWKKNWQIHFH